MLARAQIKENAKAAFRAAYWPCVGALVLVYLVYSAPNLLYLRPNPSGFAALLILAATIMLLPLTVGGCGYSVGIYRRDGDTRVGRVFNIAFSQNYARKLGGMLWMELWLFLWLMLAYAPLIIGNIASFASAYTYSIPTRADNWHAALGASTAILAFTIVATIGLMIPAIIKTLAYSMTPFILADCPERAYALEAHDQGAQGRYFRDEPELYRLDAADGADVRDFGDILDGAVLCCVLCGAVRRAKARRYRNGRCSGGGVCWGVEGVDPNRN